MGARLPLLAADSPAATTPDSAVVYVEARDLGSLVKLVQHSAARELVQASPQSEQAWQTPQARKLLAAIQIAEAQLGMDAWSAVQKLLSGTVTLSLHPHAGSKQPDGVLLVRPADSEILPRLRERLQPFLVLAEDNIKSFEKDGALHIQVGDELSIVYADDWLGISNRRELLDGAGISAPGNALARLDSFQAMERELDDDHLVRVFVNTQAISEAAGGRFIPEKLDNALASLLFGGITEQLAQSAWAGLTLDVDKSGLALTGGVATSEPDEPWTPFFSDPDLPGAATIPILKDRLAGFTLHRDFAAWYQNREKLLREDLLPEFDKFEAGIGNFLPGRDFGTDVLPLMGSNLTFVTAPQDFKQLDGRPGVQLPGFAVLIDLAKPEEGSDIAKLFMQTLSFVLNVNAGQQGREPMVQSSETWKDVQIAFSRHLERPKGERLPIAYNFTVASAQVGDRYIISSSLDLCRTLIDRLQAPDDDRQQTNRNFELDANFGPIADILATNRDFLTGREIQKGKSPEQAAAEFDLGLTLLRMLKQLRLSTGRQAESLRATLKIDW